MSYSARVLGRTSLPNYWRLGETSGTTALASKGTVNGTYANGVVLGATGAILNDTNKAALFDGSNDRVTLPAITTVTNFTIEGWSYITSTANPNGNNAMYAGSGNVRLLVRGGGGTSGIYAGVTLGGVEYALQPNVAQSNLNTWVHWALVRNGSTLTLYRNGVQIGQLTTLPAATTANISGNIGVEKTTLAYSYGGRIDEIALYNAALTATEISGDYSAGITP